MNFFRLIADLLHLASFLILIFKIRSTKNVLGISYKSQEIYLAVFILRYWDLFLYFVSYYNVIMKILYISLTAYLIYLIRVKKPYCLSFDHVNDDFPHLKFIYPGAALLTLFIHTEFSLFELSWSYSIWLESLAIIPQLYMIQRSKECENITGHYMAALGFYRFFYIINWIYRYMTAGSFSWVSCLGGILQTALYSDFLYIYIKSNKSQKTFSLPV
ncbi:hypothetical protein IMG5_166930 [Ichthyophthirius multifiliis]|uniref:ER lumen protein-retaining receptor n=1 Tax=Ichthyophthirius multifiliis TaxID=5932 RepID=G0R0T9_ICHMU|nr:hypothetical protein IMG5_166930 [Ichthyophthirius multifiliis]EGR28899.1 hypothetical protein IMG5_166930 [Ichthyophthirius multifiliis]|eukprot:XP_004030135.1 hypothetical protein IMG5_166930 [Ichthyophthirius multifiliis]